MTRSVALGDVVQKVDKTDPTRTFADSDFAYVDIGAIDQDRKAIGGIDLVAGANAPSRARQVVASGDVLVSTVRPNLNAVAEVPPDLDGAIASTGFTVLRPRSDRLLGRYLFHWVRTPSFVTEMTRLATGASYPAVSDAIVLRSSLPLPPIEEQRRIAAVLDQADEVRAKRRTSLALLDSLTESIFLDMFGSDLSDSLVPLNDLIDPERLICYGILMPGEDLPGGRPYVRVVDMKDGTIDYSSVRRTTAEIDQKYRRSRLRSGDLLMSIRGHVGRLAEVPSELDGANITQDSARVGVVGAHPRFVLAQLRSQHCQRWMARHIRGVAVRGINIGDVRRIPLFLPSSQDQQTFVDRVNALEAQRGLGRTSEAELDSLFASLQQKAFVGAL